MSQFRWLRLVVVSGMVAALLVGMVTVVSAAGTISASPTNVPFGQFSTTITYSSDSQFFLFVTHNTVSTLVSSGASASNATFKPTFINSGSYSFSLRSSNDATSTTNVLSSVVVQKLGPSGQPGPQIVLSKTGQIPVAVDTTAPQSVTANFDSGNDTEVSLFLTRSTSATTTDTVLVSKTTFNTNPIVLNFIVSGVYNFTLKDASNTTVASQSVTIGPAIAVNTPGEQSILLPRVLTGLEGTTLVGNYVDAFGRPTIVCVGTLTQSVLGGTLSGLTGNLGLLTGIAGINLLGGGGAQMSPNAFNASGFDTLTPFKFNLPDLFDVVAYVHQDAPAAVPITGQQQLQCPTLSLVGTVVNTLLGPGTGGVNLTSLGTVTNILNGLLGGNPLLAGLLGNLNLNITGGSVTPAPGTTIDRVDYYLL